MIHKEVELIGFIDCEFGSGCKKWDKCPHLDERSVGKVTIPANLIRGDEIIDFLGIEFNKRIITNCEDCTDPENPICGASVKRFMKWSHFTFRKTS